MKKVAKLSLAFIALVVCFSFMHEDKQPKPCRYYAYILYGNAALSSNIRQTEKVYKETRIFKAEEGYQACCNFYCSNSCGGFRIINIGPFESEATCYAELGRQRTRIENDGYQLYTRGRHLMIAVLDMNYKECR